MSEFNKNTAATNPNTEKPIMEQEPIQPEVVAVDTVEAEGLGIISRLADLPAGSLITEKGLAEIFGKCTASIKAAVDRGELPRPVKLMGKPTWTAGSVIAFHEARLEAEGRKFKRLGA